MARTKESEVEDMERRRCKTCRKLVARSGDIPRHNRVHLSPEEKLKQMYRCPWANCSYGNLQKTNVETHLRRHLKEQNQICLDCDFKTTDPGSLTRHRKCVHGYVPKLRKKRARVPSPCPTASPASFSTGSGSFWNVLTVPAAPPVRVAPAPNCRLISTSVSPTLPRSPLSLPDGRSLISDNDEEPYYSYRSNPRFLVFEDAATTVTTSSMRTTVTEEYESDKACD